MHALIEKLEKLEKEQDRLEKICTIGVQPKIDKIRSQIETVYNSIAKNKKAVAEYEDRYGCDFDWEI